MIKLKDYISSIKIHYEFKKRLKNYQEKYYTQSKNIVIPEKSIEHLEQRVKHASVVNERGNSRKEFSKEMRNYCSGNLYLFRVPCLLD